jgi:hypothetical protein|tara:strand:- start:443 stop:625 length:183 start_codon:yes stop_codon:yes gene_type:complete
MKKYKVTLSEVRSLQFDVEASSEKEAEESLKCGMGWDFNYDDADIETLEICCEDVEEDEE